MRGQGSFSNQLLEIFQAGFFWQIEMHKILTYILCVVYPFRSQACNHRRLKSGKAGKIDRSIFHIYDTTKNGPFDVSIG